MATKLSPRKIDSLSCPSTQRRKKVYDGGTGMYVEVTPRAKTFMYRHQGKEEKYGQYPGLGLADARAVHAFVKAELGNGRRFVDAFGEAQLLI